MRLDKCCFFVDLRVGSLIIGYLGIVGSLIVSILAIFGMNGYIIPYAAELKQIKFIWILILVKLFIWLVGAILHLIFDIVLLVGLYQHKRRLVQAYLIVISILVAISALISFISIFICGLGVWEIILSLVIIVHSTYFLVVIRSYFLKMVNLYKRPAMYNTA